jgi:hypothetical protein
MGADVHWDDKRWKDDTKKNALDGVEECAKGVMLTQAKEDCPVDHGIMRGSLTTERDDANLCVYLGGGGPAEDYIYWQEVRRDLHHNVGKAGFIRDSVDMHAPKLKGFIQSHVKG